MMIYLYAFAALFFVMGVGLNVARAVRAWRADAASPAVVWWLMFASAQGAMVILDAAKLGQAIARGAL